MCACNTRPRETETGDPWEGGNLTDSLQGVLQASERDAVLKERFETPKEWHPGLFSGFYMHARVYTYKHLYMHTKKLLL